MQHYYSKKKEKLFNVTGAECNQYELIIFQKIFHSSEVSYIKWKLYIYEYIIFIKYSKCT